MKVYRFEHLDNRCGPYTWRDSHGEQPLELLDMVGLHCSDDDRWPTWAWDDIDCDNLLEPIAGCETIRDLCEWFDGFVMMLFRLGFRIAVYEVPTEGVLWGNSGYQVAFDLNAAELVETLDKLPVDLVE